MKNTRQSRRLRNPRQKDADRDKPFFSKKHSDRQPFFGPQPHSASPVQTKLKVGQPGDKYEQEADAVANRVVNGQHSGHTADTGRGNAIQRITLATPQEDEKLGTAESRMEKDKLIQEKKEPQLLQTMGDKEEESVQKAENEEEDSVQMQEQEEESVQKVENEEESAQLKEQEEEPVQMKEEEEESIQTKEQEEESVQMKEEEEEPVQMKEEEEESVQTKEQEEGSLQMQEQEEESVQMKENDEELIQQKGTDKSPSNPHLGKKLKSSSGKGSPLPEKTRLEMEQAFGLDFSKVRIHTDQKAIEMCKSLGAQAFTNGINIYFNTGKFNPDSSQGKKLLAHELTHVVQQKNPAPKK